MTGFNLNRRRVAPHQLADHAEACEVRVLLSGVAIYPAQAATGGAVSVSTGTQNNIVALTPADYNGSWSIGGTSILQLIVKGSNPETGKVKGSIDSPFLAGGSAKFKGKITNGSELSGKSSGNIISGPYTGKAKVEISVHLTDSTHFEGMVTNEIKGFPPSTGMAMGTKL